MSSETIARIRHEGGVTVATRQKLKELWMHFTWSGASERYDAERSFDRLFQQWEHPGSHDAICAVIDRVKSDERPLDTDEYAAMIEDAFRGIAPPPEVKPRECDACADEVSTLSSDDLCDACIGEGMERCPNCGEHSTTVEPAYGMRMCASCQHNARRSGA